MTTTKAPDTLEMAAQAVNYWLELSTVPNDRRALPSPESQRRLQDIIQSVARQARAEEHRIGKAIAIQLHSAEQRLAALTAVLSQIADAHCECTGDSDSCSPCVGGLADIAASALAKVKT